MMIIAPYFRARKGGKEMKGKYGGILGEEEGNSATPLSNMLHHMLKALNGDWPFWDATTEGMIKHTIKTICFNEIDLKTFLTRCLDKFYISEFFQYSIH